MSVRGLALGRLLRSLSLAAFILTTGSGLLLADDRGNVLAMRAADLEAQGRCDEVVSLHRDEAPDDARIALVAGRCQVRSRDYAGAVTTLTAARELHNAPADIDLQLGMAQYHLGAHDAARESLDRARARGAEGALLELYSGLLQLQANDARAAALSFEHARRSNARAVEPVASYYAFLAWRSVNEQQRSQTALARLREEDPDGPWIEEAERILAGSLAAGTPTWWLNAEAGLAYDSNAVVKGSGVASVFIQGDVVDGKGDGRSLWSFDVGTKLLRSEKWSGGILGAYTGTAHFDIHEFDTHYPTVGAWLDYDLGARTTLRGRYDYGYAWVNYDPFVSRNVLSGTLFQSWGEYGQTEWTLSGGWSDFRYDRVEPPRGSLADIDQDGSQVTNEILHRYEPGFEDLEDLELRFGYRYAHYDSDGREFDYDTHRFLAGWDVTLPYDIAWDGWLAFTYRPYEHTSKYADETDPRHKDHIWELGSELEKFISDDVSVLARYYFTDSGSNTDAYDYDRHIVGAYVRIRFR